LLFICITCGLLELLSPKLKIATVRVECIGSGLMAVLQLAATLLVTIDGPSAACQSNTSKGVCKVMTALVPISWLFSFTLIVYFLALIITTIIHTTAYEGIWVISVYSAPWFEFGSDHPSLRSKSPSSTRSDLEKDDGTWRTTWVAGPWARKFLGRRGVDKPFATQSDLYDVDGQSPPRMPPKAKAKIPELPRYLDLHHEVKPQGDSQLPPFRPLLLQSSNSMQTRIYDKFRRAPPPPPLDLTRNFRTKEPEDDDEPLPLPRLSEWIRADAARGVNVHTIPAISP